MYYWNFRSKERSPRPILTVRPDKEELRSSVIWKETKTNDRVSRQETKPKKVSKNESKPENTHRPTVSKKQIIRKDIIWSDESDESDYYAESKNISDWMCRVFLYWL